LGQSKPVRASPSFRNLSNRHPSHADGDGSERRRQDRLDDLWTARTLQRDDEIETKTAVIERRWFRARLYDAKTTGVEMLRVVPARRNSWVGGACCWFAEAGDAGSEQTGGRLRQRNSAMYLQVGTPHARRLTKQTINVRSATPEGHSAGSAHSRHRPTPTTEDNVMVEQWRRRLPALAVWAVVRKIK
jgi:hypothetical protein